MSPERSGKGIGAPLDASARALLDASPCPLVVVDLGGRPLGFNEAARRRLGGGPRSLLRVLRAVAGRGGCAEALAALRAVLAGEVAEAALPGVAAGAAVRRRRGAPEGRIVGALLALGESAALEGEEYARVLERQLAEIALERRRVEARLVDLLEASPDAHLELDREGRLVSLNAAARRLLGAPEGSLHGRRLLDFVAAESLAVVRDAAALLRDVGRVEGIELTLAPPGGRRVAVLASARAARDESGRLLVSRLVLRDLSERDQLRRHLLEADRLAATGRLAAGIAHEINNPLQALVMHLSIVRAAPAEDSVVEDSWTRIEESARRIRRIVADLQALRGEAGEPDDSADIGRVVEEALALARKPLAHRGVRIECELARELPPVSISPRRLLQVVLNLVLHAMESMAKGGVLRVRTRAVPLVGRVEILLGESGQGLEGDELGQIVDPLLAGEGPLETRLGLFVAYGLVRDAGGQIHVATRSGLGTVFRVALPPASEEPASAPPRAFSGRSSPETHTPS